MYRNDMTLAQRGSFGLSALAEAGAVFFGQVRQHPDAPEEATIAASFSPVGAIAVHILPGAGPVATSCASLMVYAVTST